MGKLENISETDSVKNFDYLPQTWAEVAAAYDQHPEKWLPIQDPKNADDRSVNAYFQLIKIIRIYKEGTALKYDDKAQRKFFPWFDKKEDKFCFSRVGSHYGNNMTPVGPRLTTTDSEMARYIATMFSDIYNDYYCEGEMESEVMNNVEVMDAIKEAKAQAIVIESKVTRRV